MDIFEQCPILENDNFIVRLIEEKDVDDLLAVYSDKFALPFFNSDNCHGSNFYCATREDMANAVKYWLIEYRETRGFVRFSVVDKTTGKAVGTIEMFKRKAQDFFNDCGLLRMDLKSDYERTAVIYDILSLVTEPFFDLFDCNIIATKGALYAVDRVAALNKMRYVKSEEPLVDHYQTYYDYYVIRKDR